MIRLVACAILRFKASETLLGIETEVIGIVIGIVRALQSL